MLTSAERPLPAILPQWVVALAVVPAFALFSILLLSITQVDRVPGLLVALLVALAALSAWKPGPALMFLAAAVPVAMWTGRWWNGRVAWAEVLVVAFAAGYCGRAAWTRRIRLDSLSLPIVLFTSIVLASLAVRLVVLQWTIGGEALWDQLTELAAGDYFVGSGGFPELDAAMRLIEGMLLLRAASSTAQTHAAFAPALIRWFVIGATGAAALNLWRLWGGAIRSDTPIATFFGYLTTLRYNVHYADVNAAGSYFVMALLVAVGLAIATRRIYWFAAAAAIATSLMLSGSRAALVAGAVAAVVWSAGRLTPQLHGKQSRSAALAVASFVLIGGAAVAVYYVAARRNVTPSSTAMDIRVEFARTTLRMLEAHPTFGVGIGQYAFRSTDYSSPTLVETYRMRQENAHNNFLQVLGELGITGLAGFLFVLWAAGRGTVRVLRRTSSPLPRAVGAGVLAFVLTWLSGHPLLIDEPAFSFWLLLGISSGWPTHTPDRPYALPGASMFRLAVICVLAALAVSLPVRAAQEFGQLDLEHRGIGLSGWHRGDDGVQYQLAGARSTLFVPAGARAVTFGLRGLSERTELEVALELDGRPADLVRVSSARWHRIQLLVTPVDDSRRSRRLDLSVQGAPADDRPVLMVSKVEAR